MSSASFSTRNALQGNRALERTGEILDRIRLAPEVGNRRLRKAEMIESVRMRRQSARQNLGFSSRPFVLCGLPVKCSARWDPGSRTTEWPIRVPRHRAPELRPSLGPGPLGSAFPGNLGCPPAVSPDHLWQRRRNATFYTY